MKNLNEVYEEMKKEARDFAKKEGLKLSITRQDYDYITIVVVSGKEKVLNNKDRSDNLFHDYDLKETYKDYSSKIDEYVDLKRYENTDNSNEVAQRLSDMKMTEYGFKIAKKLFNIMHKNYWDESDIQTDYFNQAFYGNLYLGSYEKPYQIKEA